MRTLAEIDASIEAHRAMLDADKDRAMMLIDILLDERLEAMKYVAENSPSKG